VTREDEGWSSAADLSSDNLVLSQQLDAASQRMLANT
jgi:hypothetical protein